MRTFIILCLAAIASAQKLGYKYVPAEYSDSASSFAPSNGHHRGTTLSGSDNLSPYIDSHGSRTTQNSDDLSSLGESQGELQKEFYLFSVNEDDFTDAAETNRLLNAVKQSIRVVFIKGPENNGLENAALALAKQAAQQKSNIYVLNKQPDLSDLANKLNNIAKNASNKPEVHFVKYRTPEDATNAQKAIQSQYDSVDGPSQNINGGDAPVLNYASQSPHASPSAQAPGKSYLPSSVLRRLRFAS